MKAIVSVVFGMVFIPFLLDAIGVPNYFSQHPIIAIYLLIICLFVMIYIELSGKKEDDSKSQNEQSEERISRANIFLAVILIAHILFQFLIYITYTIEDLRFTMEVYKLNFITSFIAMIISFNYADISRCSDKHYGVYKGFSDIVGFLNGVSMFLTMSGIFSDFNLIRVFLG